MRFNKLFIFIVLGFLGCSASKDFTSKSPKLNYPNELKVIDRSEWGWIPIKSEFKTHEIKFITIHHGGVEFTEDKDPAEHVRNLQSWSRKEKGWIDIPYHFMIDLQGNIYEARPLNIPGDTNTEYDPTNHALIEIMGNYELQEFNEDQLNSMVALIKYLSDEFNVTADNIKTHKDYSAMTVCPGRNIYKYFEDGTIMKLLEQK